MSAINVTDIPGMATRLVENGADPTGRDTFTLPPGLHLDVRIDGGPVQRLTLPAGTLVGEVTAEREARERAAAEARIRDWEAATRPPRAGRPVVPCEGQYIDNTASIGKGARCGKLPARRGEVPWSREEERPRTRWLCIDCWHEAAVTGPDYPEDY